MNEEHSVLNFFSQEENLPLALIAAEHLDGIRLQHNNRFWKTLRERLDALIAQSALPWRSELTEDRNSEDCLVGLRLEPLFNQRTFLRPFMEQQLLGERYRIYYGLMWNTAPEPAQKNLTAVETLHAHLGTAGFKHSDSFLAWQWSPWYPRRKDFLLRFSTRQDELMQEAMRPWHALLEEFGEPLRLANLALSEAPRSATISLDRLRGNNAHRPDFAAFNPEEGVTAIQGAQRHRSNPASILVHSTPTQGRIENGNGSAIVCAICRLTGPPRKWRPT